MTEQDGVSSPVSPEDQPKRSSLTWITGETKDGFLVCQQMGKVDREQIQAMADKTRRGVVVKIQDTEETFTPSIDLELKEECQKPISAQGKEVVFTDPRIDSKSGMVEVIADDTEMFSSIGVFTEALRILAESTGEWVRGDFEDPTDHKIKTFVGFPFKKPD